jgi:DNA-binding CsgD family transcriptional regulator
VSPSLETMVLEIVGREEELASVRAFIEGRTLPAALLVEGEAGIGKSTVWHWGVDHARLHGFRVLLSRPVEAERGLAHVGLGDLLEGVLDDVLPSLSPPRRRALEVALLLEETSAGGVDPRALGIATRNALQLLAGEGRLVVAIDDLQWLDASSKAALSFALRRLGASRVALLLARRFVDGTQPSGLERALGVERVERLRLGPVSVGALHRLLRDRLGRPFARQTLLRIHERSGGNPFFALELAQALDTDVDPTQPLPVPETLEELVRGRISDLPASTRTALALASALGTPSESLLERAGVPADSLEPAVAAHVIERANGAIRFTHPLLSSVLYQDLGDERLRVHARIAEIVDDPLLHARHLALSIATPDAEVAAVLTGAARIAADRGAFPVAAELAEHALRLTPPDEHEERHRRALTAAHAHRTAGEWIRARTIAADLLAETELDSYRADGLVLLAELEGVDRSIALLEEALREATSRPALQSVIHSRLAWSTRFRMGFRDARKHAHAALELADDLDDDALRVGALTVLTLLASTTGDAEASSHAARAHELAIALGDAELLKGATEVVAEVLALSGRSDEARALLEREYRAWRDRDEPHGAEMLAALSWVELSDGRWELAADYAARARDLNVQYGLERPQDYLPIAWIAVHRGQLELAREESERALELAKEQLGLHPPFHLAILGLVALWSGDARSAAVWLGKADRQATALGWGEPTLRPWSGDYAEALLELGRIDDAVRVLDVWQADAARLGRSPVLAHVTRCRGLVAAAEGDVRHAVSLLELATARHEAVGDRFGRARALLARGIVLRRARQKRAAREAIRAAFDGFEELGAATWAEKARSELGRIGGRTREDDLTAAERRVAVLVAEGRTNREVAAALFLGERTVAGHLTHVSAKLGVRSRTELARRLH